MLMVTFTPRPQYSVRKLFPPPGPSQSRTLLQENTTTILEQQLSSHHPYGFHVWNISFGATATASDHPQRTNPREIQNVL